ncbi:MAG: sigma-70 family RNA polymerase sigma factor, partial [Armatimonadota bacterium]|nr:sigma-70 family RNA polymerase sigma factor [Armatimonadota bacterium]
MQSDPELIACVCARDASAFETIFIRYQEVVQRHVTHIVGDEHAAADLTQEVFLRVWMRAEQWDQRGAFKSWLLTIATNLALNHLRSLRRRRE